MARFKAHKRILLVFAIILNIVSFVANWLLYADIVNLQPGLVFGPYPPVFQHVVLGLCILSALVNIIEVISLYSELFRKEASCWLDGHTTSAMAIWLDDIPKAGIMLYIAACHDMAISIEEVVRAGLLMCTLIVRLIAYLVRETCVRRRQDSGLPTREEVLYRRTSCRGCQGGAIILGLVIKFTAFLVIYFFTYFRVYPGGITYKMPSGLWEPKRDVSRFVDNNSSIFVGIPVGEANSLEWLEITSVMNVVNHNQCRSVVELKSNKSIVKTWCGSSNSSVPVVRPLAGNFSAEIDFGFNYVKPSKSLLLGNVEYTMEVKRGLLQGAKTLAVRYLCKASESPKGKDLVKMVLGMTSKTQGEVKYVSGGSQYFPASKCWLTGKMKCEMTGMDGPLRVRHLSSNK